MTTFDTRQKAFEDKFARDADLQFKVTARRNRLLGLWAAERLGMTPEAASDYAKSVVAADFEEAGEEDVFRKVAADLGDAATEAEIRAAMQSTFTEAQRQYMDAA
ncbi:DUF1476 domain-containing protein [Glacieibacterium frigidum]|uniref:DUF1476 domain-containing protein n=1 Tax=Glacieibacterium frigidum TaxID=2593303 RepID=A0A552UFR0_9SPHN|nr:DUF1476 domain-containing protein [Glacieibacterium frigidum]TRW17062.1 DUF1476 domain-containing protein [Glacieibacterium frigidum]